MTSAFDRVSEWLGGRIASGELPPGAVVNVDGIVASTGCSRSIVREAVRVVSGLGLVVARQRVGLVVQPTERWTLLDPRVIRWRMQGPDRERQVAELIELRRAVEPDIAGAAARRRSEAHAIRLRELAAVMGAATSPDVVLAADQEFHGLLIEASANPMFGTLAAAIAEALREHTLEGPGESPDPYDIALHARLAAAVADGRDDAAEALSVEILQRVHVARRRASIN